MGAAEWVNLSAAKRRILCGSSESRKFNIYHSQRLKKKLCQDSQINLTMPQKIGIKKVFENLPIYAWVHIKTIT